jgi:hypothetical protein
MIPRPPDVHIETDAAQPFRIRWPHTLHALSLPQPDRLDPSRHKSYSVHVILFPN